MVVDPMSIAVAVGIFVFVFLLANCQPHPGIANPLKEVLLPLGFTWIETTDPYLCERKATLRLCRNP
jgi:hypothetical protein